MSKKRSSVKKRERNKYKREKRALQVQKKERKAARRRAAATVGASSFAADLLDAARQVPNVEGRRTMARQAVSEDPDFAYAWAFLAEQAENPAAAMELYERAMTAAESRLEATRRALAEMAGPDENDPEAIDPREGFEDDALEALDYVKISRLYMEALRRFGEGQDEGAGKVLRQAIRKAPDVAELLLEGGDDGDDEIDEDDPAALLAQGTRRMWEAMDALGWLEQAWRS